MFLDQLPVIPRRLLNRHVVDQPADTRFRACARLLQALWREEQGLPIGDNVARDGELHPLGSRIAAEPNDGSNFMSPAIAELAWRESIYREHGAVIEENRLWTNLLSSQPLTFNVIGPLRLNSAVATAVLRSMCPDLADAEVTAVRFEHSPGRGDQTLTGDNTAFDAFIVYRRETGLRGLVAMEFKYAERGRENRGTLSNSCEAAVIASQLYIDCCADELRGRLQQLTREHILAQTMLGRGDYDEGRFVVVAPALNPDIRDMSARYRDHLAMPTEGHIRFETWCGPACKRDPVSGVIGV